MNQKLDKPVYNRLYTGHRIPMRREGLVSYADYHPTGYSYYLHGNIDVVSGNGFASEILERKFVGTHW